MIQLRNLSLAYADQILFDRITCTFKTEKIGLVGRNGAGKSTLLKIMAGLLKPDEGDIVTERGKKIAYMPQELVLHSTKNVFDEAFATFDEEIKLEQEKLDIEAHLDAGTGDTEKLLDRYAIVDTLLKNFDKQKALERTQEILHGVGFTAALLQKQVNELSTGWQMRLVLAKLLLQDADFYLFDEPTNHLDMVSKEWFYHFLRSFKGGFLMAAHDRHFLDNACSHIFELERGNGRLFTGNFGAYITQKESLREHLLATRERQEREIARKQASIDKMKALASRATQAQSMIKQLERIELVEVEPPLPTIRVKLPHTARPGKVVLTLSNLAHNFGDKPIFRNVNAQIIRGQKVALVAPNGVGKTTLFNVITGKIALQQGSIEFGYNVEHAVFEQDQTKVLAPDNTIVDEVKSSTPASEAHVRAMLGALLFSGDDILKKIKVLSGGERNRVAMAKVFLRNANFLLLDEPTNHLDLYAKEVLLNALLDYDGTLLFVSHDHDFINRLATRIIELTPHGTSGYDGSYEGYLWSKKQQEQMHAPKPQPKQHNEPASAIQKQSAEKNSALRKEIHELEREINKLEKRIQEATHQLSLATYGSADFQKYTDKITRDTAQLESLNARWQELYSTLE